MKTQRPYPALTITPKGERALVDGHPETIVAAAKRVLNK